MNRRGQLDRYAYSMAVRYPRLGILCADWVHRVQYAFDLGMARKNLNSGSDWKKLLGSDVVLDLSTLRYRQSRNRFRQEFLDRLLKKIEPERALGLVRWKHLHYLRQPVEQGRPVIIALSHIGPLQASVLALLDLHRPVTFLLYRSLSGILPEGWELCFTDEKGSSRVQAFKRCREKLKAGLPVAIACDVFTREDVGVPVTVFDMELRIMRGFAALARSSGAMIVPVSIEWEGRNRLLFQAHPPLKSTDGDRSDREGFETAVLREYAAHIDQFMQTHSYELHPHRVELFLNAWNRLKGGGERKDPETMAPGVSTPKMTKYGAQENRIETR